MKRNHRRLVTCAVGWAPQRFCSDQTKVGPPLPRRVHFKLRSCSARRARVQSSVACLLEKARHEIVMSPRSRATLSFRRQSNVGKILIASMLLDKKLRCCCRAQSSLRCSNRFASTTSAFLLVSASRECDGGLTRGYRDETQCAGDRRCFCLCRRDPVGGLLSFQSAIRKKETRGLLNHDCACVSVQNNKITKATPEPSGSGVFIFTATHRAPYK
jgi:hypothetical protein